MKKYLAVVVSAVGLLLAVTSGVAFADQCRYNCYDGCNEQFPGAGNSLERHLCYWGCDIDCSIG